MPLQKTRKRLLDLFSQIENDSIKQIIVEVISLENEYRFSSAMYFPKKKIEDVIDAEARNIESNNKYTGNSK